MGKALSIPSPFFDFSGVPRAPELLRHRPSHHSYCIFHCLSDHFIKNKPAVTIMSYFLKEYWLHGQSRIERTASELVDGMFGFYTIKTISPILKRLCTDGWLEHPNREPEDVKSIVISLRGTAHPSKGYLSCDWCGTRAFGLHNHHYPIPRQNGGTKTVEICHNCHFLYHHIKDFRTIRPGDRAVELFDTMDWLPLSLWERFAEELHIYEGDIYGTT